MSLLQARKGSIIDESHANFNLVGIIIAGIAVGAIIATILGCWRADCCHMPCRRIRPCSSIDRPPSSSSRSSTDSDVENDAVEKRAAGILASNIYFGKELVDYRTKIGQKNRHGKRSSIGMPVIFASLRQARSRSTSAAAAAAAVADIKTPVHAQGIATERTTASTGYPSLTIGSRGSEPASTQQQAIQGGVTIQRRSDGDRELSERGDAAAGRNL